MTQGLGEWDQKPEETSAPALYYPDVETFMRELLAPTYRRSLSANSLTWCPEWWRHAEAIARLEALWRAWEHLRLDPATGMSVWYRDHADHHMAVLLNADGPFKGCSPEKGHAQDRLAPLDSTPAPNGLFIPAEGAASALATVESASPPGAAVSGR
ncbi:MAG: DUF4913 domain-containing protein [Solirubrobacterales bacterium]|nr:DUF4913 domain-containing protein [Solirubrobacterales bacterium]